MAYSEDPKDWEIVKRTTDGIVCSGPCYVKWIQVEGAAGGIGTATFYDGQGTSGEELLAISSIISMTNKDEYEIPVYFSKGVYVDLSTNATCARVQLQRIKEG